MKKVCQMIGKYFGVIAVLFLVLGMTMPPKLFMGTRQGWWCRCLKPAPRHCNVWYGHNT